MSSAWPWLAVAGFGALHGLNPANGWLFAAAQGLPARDARGAGRALLPIAAGHAASIAVVAVALAQGMAMDSAQMLWAGAVVAAGALLCLLRGARRAGTGLWCFLMATAHGTGMMLVPALVPLCLAGDPAREITASGSLWLALAAVGVHLAAMLATIRLIAGGLQLLPALRRPQRA